MGSPYISKPVSFILILFQVVLLLPLPIMSFHSISTFPRRHIPSRCRHFAAGLKNPGAEDTKRQKTEELMGASKLSLAPMMEYSKIKI
jgi:hypothetical protein